MRFVNSGTEATMDAIRVARAATGRDKIIKMEGSYHGHHDSVLFSVVPEADVLDMRFHTGGDRRQGLVHDRADLQGRAAGAVGHRRSSCRSTTPAAVEEALADNEGEIAAVILEPVMMNIGIVVPEPGYLQALRDACEKHGAVLIFDEVKCGGTIAYGGTTERYGVQPHLAAYAKAIGGGVDDRRVRRRGPLHGVGRQGRRAAGHLQRQPAVERRRAGRAHAGPDEGRLRPPRQAGHACSPRGATGRSPSTGIPAHTVDLGAKGCVSYRTSR